MWGGVSAQASLLGFWIALGARPWKTRTVYGVLHLIGLVFCVLAAGRMNLDQLSVHYVLVDVLRDVPAMFVSSLIAGLLLCRFGWRLHSGASDECSDIVAGVRRMQIPLGEFIKWFTLLCIVLGMNVSLLPPPAILTNDWLWRSRMSHYAEFSLAVCVPAGLLASLLFLGILSGALKNVRWVLWMGAISCGTTLLWIAAVVAGFNLAFNAYHFLLRPTRPRVRLPDVFVSLQTIGYGLPFDTYLSLLAFAAGLVLVALMAMRAGWRMRRVDHRV